MPFRGDVDLWKSHLVNHLEQLGLGEPEVEKALLIGQVIKIQPKTGCNRPGDGKIRHGKVGDVPCEES